MLTKFGSTGMLYVRQAGSSIDLSHPYLFGAKTHDPSVSYGSGTSAPHEAQRPKTSNAQNVLQGDTFSISPVLLD
eukprot:SAG31_NODE_204_length_20414_cov_19.143392_19_plen_75_part_00